MMEDHGKIGIVFSDGLLREPGGRLIYDVEDAASRNEQVSTMAAHDWVGSDDPDNPRNWSTSKKIYHTLIPTLFGFVISLGTSVVSPTIDSVADYFNVSSNVATLSFSSYVIGLAFGPLIGSPASEVLGRRAVYLISIPISTLFTLGAGFAPNIQTFIILRFIAGGFGGPVLAVGPGTGADIFPVSQRSTMTTLFSLGPFVATGVGPVMAAYINSRKDWRWVQWVLVFFLMASFIFSLFQSETYKKTILQRRAKRLNIGPTPLASTLFTIRHTLTIVLLRPLRMLVTEPIVAFLSIYVAFNFSVLYSFLTAVPLVFGVVYRFTPEQQNLPFIAITVGCLMVIPTQLLLDYVFYQRYSRSSGAPCEGRAVIPEHRLYAAMIGSIGLPIGIFWFAWSARTEVHWIVPILSLIPFAWGNLLVFISAVLYTVDVYGAIHGASALAANALMRYIFGAAFPLFSVQMYQNLGFKWASSLLGFITVALLPVPWVLFHLGPVIRQKSNFGRTES